LSNTGPSKYDALGQARARGQVSNNP